MQKIRQKSRPFFLLTVLLLQVSCNKAKSGPASVSPDRTQEASYTGPEEGQPDEKIEASKRLHDAPVKSPELPALPADADSFESTTLEIQGVGPQGQPGMQQVISRTTKRVHVLMPSMNQEWLFVRNPKDGRRVTGLLIVHNNRVILEYPETDLRLEGVANGWADIIRVDQKLVKSSRSGVDAALLEDPGKRFPNYRYFEIADWREELHDNGEQSGHGHSHGHGHRH